MSSSFIRPQNSVRVLVTTVSALQLLRSWIISTQFVAFSLSRSCRMPSFLDLLSSGCHSIVALAFFVTSLRFRVQTYVFELVCIEFSFRPPEIIFIIIPDFLKFFSCINIIKCLIVLNFN